MKVTADEDNVDPYEPVKPTGFTPLTPKGYCTDWIYASDNTKDGEYDDVSNTAE
jgi:hypothetical protein